MAKEVLKGDVGAGRVSQKPVFLSFKFQGCGPRGDKGRRQVGPDKQRGESRTDEVTHRLKPVFLSPQEFHDEKKRLLVCSPVFCHR
jgi:hypothetical protein